MRKCSERYYIMFSLTGFDATLSCAADDPHSRLALVTLEDLIREDSTKLPLFS